MQKLVILDDVFDAATLAAIAAFDYGRGERWYDLGASPLHEPIIDICRQHFDLSGMVGYEMWRNAGELGWHIDKDEKLYEAERRHSFPRCSAVYYAVVENVNGGEFFTEDLRFFPKPNRLLMFSPGVPHAVAAYTGRRIAVSINPWDHRL